MQNLAKEFKKMYLHIGKDIILRNTEIFNNYGKKALIVTGRNSSKNNGSLKDVTEALERCNIQYISLKLNRLWNRSLT